MTSLDKDLRSRDDRLAESAEAWNTSTVRDAVRAVIRSKAGLAAIEGVLETNDLGDDPVWQEDRLVRLVVDRLREAGR